MDSFNHLIMPSFKILLTITALAAAVLTGCKEERVMPGQDYLVFGWYHGACQGEGCVDIFKLDKNAGLLYEDSTDRYPSSTAPYEGQFGLTSAAQYQLVQDLPALLPHQLLTQPIGTIGQPDFADGGGYYVEITNNGQRKFWLIDTNKDNIPTYLYPFVDALQAKIIHLQ
ncbi:hypothetical protein [Hymenobacter algoricola]|uniref:Lipoprotein n=1 Tax=Hymenobacter algoricola TaxID=486267 RepID=A0ABP7NVG6_9BACT